MKNPILNSDEIFQLLDYSLSHRKLIIRATVIDYETEDFYNIDITFISTDYIQVTTVLEGVEIYLGENNTSITLANNEEINLKANEHFVLISNKTTYFIGAKSIEITKNTLNPLVSSI